MSTSAEIKIGPEATIEGSLASMKLTEGKPSFLKLDLHTHILPEDIPDFHTMFGYGEFVRLEHNHPCKARMIQGNKFFRDIDDNCYRPESRLKDMEETGVTVQVLSTVPVMFSYWAKPEDCLMVSKFLNDHIAAVCKKHPKRFVGLGTVPMHEPDMAIKELERCVNELGLAGIQIGSHVNDMTLADPKLFPIFEAAERLGACIFVHPWDMVGQDLMKKYWLPWLVGMPAESSLAICSLIFGGVFERLPKLRVCFAHGGGSFPGTIGRIEHGWKVRPDLCAVDNKRNPREYLGRFWLDSLVHDQAQLRQVLDLVGVDRVALGSDYPFPLGEAHPGQLLETMPGLSAEDKARILWRNGLEFLGLKEEAFLETTGSDDAAEKEASTDSTSPAS